MMKAILNRLGMNRPAAGTKSEQSSSDNKEASVEQPAKTIEVQTRTDVLMPDIYDKPDVDRHKPDVDQQPIIKKVKDPEQVLDSSEGFDPYDTCSFIVTKK